MPRKVRLENTARNDNLRTERSVANESFATRSPTLGVTAYTSDMRPAPALLAVFGLTACQALLVLDGKAERDDARDASADAAADQVSPDAPAAGDAVGAVVDGAISPDDGGRDAGFPSTWCNSQTPHDFCCDFDKPPVSTGWNSDASLATNGGTVELVTQHRSPPSSFASSTPAVAAGVENVRARLCAEFQGYPSQIHVAFDVWPAEGGPSGEPVVVASVRITLDTVTSYINLARSDSVWSLRASNLAGGATPSDTARDLSTGPQLKNWSRVRLETVIAPNYSTTTKAYVENAEVGTITGVAPQSGNVDVCLGMTNVRGPAPAQSILFDNVTVDTNP